jgi:hypothetical protein
MHERYWERRDNWQDRIKLLDAHTIPSFSLDNLPPAEAGFLYGNLQGFLTQWRGLQECPWECRTDPMWGHLTF